MGHLEEQNYDGQIKKDFPSHRPIYALVHICTAVVGLLFKKEERRGGGRGGRQRERERQTDSQTDR